MAISSLALIFNNPEIFKTKGVKTRKGEAVTIMRNNSDISSTTITFLEYIAIIKKKAEVLKYLPLEKENYKKLDEYIKQVIILNFLKFYFILFYIILFYIFIFLYFYFTLFYFI